MAGHAKQVTVTINNDGSVTVEDDGRGIPVEEHSDLGFSTLQGVMTVLKFGGKFSKGAYQTSGGLHGVGVSVVNFLSEWCGGSPPPGLAAGVRAAAPVGTWPSDASRVAQTTFKPTPGFPQRTSYTFTRRLQELAFLNRA
jgi:DNA gyrase subunit B